LTLPVPRSRQRPRASTRKGDPLGQIGNAVQALYLNGKMPKMLAKWQAAQFALKNK
jgi:hypothetical protein